MSTTTNINYTVDNSEDDCQAYGSSFNTSSNNFSVGNISGVSYKIGLRFTGVNIPANATITNSYITFVSYHTLSGDNCNVKITAQESVNASAFSTLSDYNGRTRTSTSQQDILDTWISSNTERIPPSESYMNAVVNEIRDYTGGTNYTALSNANIVFFIEDNSSSTNAYRDAWTYDLGYNFPVLYITYTTPASYSESLTSNIKLTIAAIKRLFKSLTSFSLELGLSPLKNLGVVRELSSSIRIKVNPIKKSMFKIFSLSSRLYSSRFIKALSINRFNTISFVNILIKNLNIKKVFSNLIDLLLLGIWIRPSFPWGYTEDLTNSITMAITEAKQKIQNRVFISLLAIRSKISKYLEEVFSSAYIKITMRAFDKTKGSYKTFSISAVLNAKTFKYRGKLLIASIALKMLKFKKDIAIDFVISQALKVIRSARTYVRKVKKRKIDILGH